MSYFLHTTPYPCPSLSDFDWTPQPPLKSDIIYVRSLTVHTRTKRLRTEMDHLPKHFFDLMTQSSIYLVPNSAKCCNKWFMKVQSGTHTSHLGVWRHTIFTRCLPSTETHSALFCKICFIFYVFPRFPELFKNISASADLQIMKF